MIALDTNLLLYSYNVHSPFHAAAKRHLDTIFSEPEPVGIPLLCVHSFLRIATHPSFGSVSNSIEEALALVENWTAQPGVQILYPGPVH